MTEQQPQDELCEAVVALWAELVDRPRVGMTDNFFLSGGNSLLAVHLIQEIQAAFDIRLRLVEFFEAPTPVELSGLVRAALERQLDEMSEAELKDILDQDLP